MSDALFILDFVADAVWNVWPAFLLSVFLGVMVRALRLDGAIRRAFSARVGVAIVLATLVGAFSPFCSCTVVPVINGLLLAGVPLAPVMAFWVASPTTDPEIFALSVATLGWPLAMARLLATLAISAGAGYLTLFLSRRGWFRNPLKGTTTAPTVAPSAPAPTTPRFEPGPAALSLAFAAPVAPAALCATPSCGSAAIAAPTCATTSCGSAVAAPMPGAPWQGLFKTGRGLDWRSIGRELSTQCWSLGRWLLLAFLMEALILLYVPQEAVASILGDGNTLAVPLAALVAVPLYLNNLSALPLVSGLLAQGMQPGAAIAFLIAGPVTTLPAMTAVWGIARRPIFALYLAVALIGPIVAGLVVSALWQ